MGALPAILPFFILHYGMDYSSVAGFMFASSFLSSLVQPTFGWLADNTSIAWLMPLGVFLAGMAMGLSVCLKTTGPFLP
jgi:FSR family fosmidomycin resistance protein-like MFS transporter